MTKAEIVKKLVSRSGLLKSAATIAVQITLDCLVESLQNGEKVELRGFGTFNVRTRRERIGRNPKTGGKVDVPAKRIAFFKPGKDLKETLKS